MTRRRIHLDTAEAGLLAPAVPTVMADFLRLEAELDNALGRPITSALTPSRGAAVRFAGPTVAPGGRAGEVVVGADTPEEAAAIARELAEPVTFVMQKD